MHERGERANLWLPKINGEFKTVYIMQISQ